MMYGISMMIESVILMLLKLVETKFLLFVLECSWKLYNLKSQQNALELQFHFINIDISILVVYNIFHILHRPIFFFFLFSCFCYCLVYFAWWSSMNDQFFTQFIHRLQSNTHNLIHINSNKLQWKKSADDLSIDVDMNKYTKYN